MKLLKILSRPVAFHRCLAELTGSVTSGLMLSQAIYWTPRTKDSDGWFWKTQEEWFEETMLSRKEQETARRRLKELGNGSVWHEQLRGVPAKLFYRIDLDALEALLLASKDETIGQSSMPESDILDCPKRANKSDRIGHTLITETTSETTQRIGEEPLATSSPEEPKAIVEGLGETLEDLYPGHATNWKTMRELQELVHRVEGTINQVKAFDGWLKTKYPMKANTPFTFKDLFPAMVKESKETQSPAKAKAKTYCGECNSGWMMNAQGEAYPCKCLK